VRRARKIRARAYDLEGNLVEYEADDLYSRAIQHEADHLEGKLFIDHLEPLTRRSLAEKLRELEIKHHRAQKSGELAPDAELVRRLDVMERPVIDLTTASASA
jgi:peptide deformylase